MLKPSYAELMEVLNKDTEDASEITSRYTIVIAASKRARQIIDGDEPMVENTKGKPLSTAVEEINEGKIKVVPEGEGTVLNLHPVFNEEDYFTNEEDYLSKKPEDNTNMDNGLDENISEEIDEETDDFDVFDVSDFDELDDETFDTDELDDEIIDDTDFEETDDDESDAEEE